ncbi:hypothetical protein D3C87_1906960 [compost metagenome]
MVLQQTRQVGKIAVEVATANQVEAPYAAVEQYLRQPWRIGQRHQNYFALQLTTPFRLAE